MSVATYSKNGAKASTAATLDKKIFGVVPDNHELLKSAYTSYLANGRINLAVTKTRGLVSGGGRKPWRQKGTGRARFGSSRNPIWRGGGIAFGPTGEENYAKKLPVAQKRQAIRQALSLASKDGRLKIIEDFDSKKGNTKQAASLLKLIDAKGSILLAVSAKNDLIVRATRNIPNLIVVSARYLNVFDVLNADTIVICQDALQSIEEWLGDKS